MSARAHSYNSKQRNQETVQGGQRPVGSRSQLRAYNFLKKKAIQNGIPFPEFELRAKSAGKPTARSQNWKKQQQLKPAAEPSCPDEPFRELQSHTAYYLYRLDPHKSCFSLGTRTAVITVSKKSPGKPTARSQNWKMQQQLKQGAEPINPDKPFCELQFLTADRVHILDPDEPCYNLGIHTADIIVSKKSSGKPTARSQNWKMQQKLKQGAEPINPDKPFCELKSHTADCVPCYNLGSETAGIPDSEKPSRKPRLRSQNWKKQQQSKQAAEGSNLDKPFCEWRSHTADCVF